MSFFCSLPILVQVWTENSQEHHFCAMVLDQDDDPIQIGSPLVGAAFVAMPVVGAELEKHDVRPVLYNVGIKASQRIGQGVSGTSLVDYRVFREAVLQNVAEAPILAAA